MPKKMKKQGMTSAGEAGGVETAGPKAGIAKVERDAGFTGSDMKDSGFLD